MTKIKVPLYAATMALYQALSSIRAAGLDWYEGGTDIDEIENDFKPEDCEVVLRNSWEELTVYDRDYRDVINFKVDVDLLFYADIYVKRSLDTENKYPNDVYFKIHFLDNEDEIDLES